jgi:cell division septation protein DedD
VDERHRARTTRPVAWALAVAWLAAGALVVDQARLPEPDPVRPRAASRPAATCWVVRVASGPASASSLRRDLRRLRQAGLKAVLRPGRSPSTRVLVLPARSRSAARAAQGRAARLGFTRSTVRGLPRTACRR